MQFSGWPGGWNNAMSPYTISLPVPGAGGGGGDWNA